MDQLGIMASILVWVSDFGILKRKFKIHPTFSLSLHLFSLLLSLLFLFPLANIPRMISASYCGSEMGDLDIYSPYSYYGSETGGDITGDINDSVWGIPAVSFFSLF